jgi:SAM-dependent methyltransferase
MQDIHKGFQDVNRATDAEVFFQFLDAADALESIQTYRQRMLDLCPPTVGQRILDVGCGIGHSALRLAPLVGATGCYDGIVVDAPDQTFTRRLVRLVADSVPSPWIGRQIPRLLRERGVQAITVIPHMILTPYAMYHRYDDQL